MAVGRMLHNKISKSLQVDRLSEHAQLLFTWMISWADDEGRIKGEPKYIKGTVIPFKKWSEKNVRGYLEDMKNVGLIHYWQINNEWFIEFVKWKEYQHIRKDRFTPSKLPSFMTKNTKQMTTNRQPIGNQMTTQSNGIESNLVELNEEDRAVSYESIDSITTEDVVEIAQHFGVTREDVERQLYRLTAYEESIADPIQSYKALLYKFVETEVKRMRK